MTQQALPDLQLITGTTQYGGWKSADIDLSMEHCANSFELTTSELWPGQSTPLPISQDQGVVIKIDGEPVITGWVDEISAAYDTHNHQVSVKGRDVAGDLVDCSVATRRDWPKSSFAQIAKDLCAPYKSVAVKVQTDIGNSFHYSVTAVDKVFDALDKAAQIAGVLIFSDGLGGLVIGRASTVKYTVPLVLGDNIKSGRASVNFQQRFSSYRMMVDPEGGDGATVGASPALVPSVTVFDGNVKRHRPYANKVGVNVNAAMLKQRAQWTANVYAARSCKATLTVQGWRNGDDLWRPNKLVTIQDPFLKLDGDYLVTRTKLRLDAKDGFTTDIEVTLPAAFSTVPIPEADDLSQLQR